MSKPKILLQFDTDPQPSTFDVVVAADAGAQVLLRHGNVTADNVEGLVHGAMFTRGPDDLKSTAIFVGGSNVAAAEAVYAKVRKCFFGPLRVSVLLDPNGANTTAAAAVLAVAAHVDLSAASCLVLGGTGPVGQRVARLLAGRGARVTVGSRSFSRAEQVCQAIGLRQPQASLTPLEIAASGPPPSALAGVQVVVAAGAAGVELLSSEALQGAADLVVAVDLNAVPPLGIGGIELQDRGTTRGRVACYGALGVGGTKMKIHKAAVAQLFEVNDRLLDAEEALAIGEQLKSQ